MSMDFNNAGKQFEGGGDFETIPEDTIVTLVMMVRPGGAGPNGWLKQGQPNAKSSGGWQYMDCEFVVEGGDFDKRKVWQNMMWDCIGPVDQAKADQTANITKKLVRAMLESARNIHPDDESPAAQTARQINDFDDFNGLTFRAKLKIEKGGAKGDGTMYPDKNQIKCAVTSDMTGYNASAAAIGTADGAVTATQANLTHIGQAADAVVAKVAATQSANIPAWAK